MTFSETLKPIVEMAQTALGPVTIFDGGFHKGGFTQFALAIWPDAQVIGFEPDPVSYHAGIQATATQATVSVRNCALGANAGHAQFFCGDMPATNSLLPRPNDNGRPYFPAAAALPKDITVEVATLDDVLAEMEVTRVDLLKLDLQGGELAALQGARRALETEQIGVILCEVTFIPKYQGQPLFWEICAHLASAGYSFYALVDVKIGPYDNEAPGPRKSQWNQADALFLSPSLRRRLDG